jgi:hypothetical protein
LRRLLGGCAAVREAELDGPIGEHPAQLHARAEHAEIAVERPRPWLRVVLDVQDAPSELSMRRTVLDHQQAYPTSMRRRT